MSIRLRPMGKPCLRSPRGALLVVAGVVAFATAPATTASADHVQPLGWYAEDGAAATVQFEDVAADGGTVLAVGRDGDAETGVPAIYRWNAGTWASEAIPADALTGVLTDVALNGEEAWVVGSATDAEGVRGLVLRYGAGGWVEQPTSLPGIPAAVALSDTTAIVGDDKGNVQALPLDGAAGAPEEALGAGAIEDVFLHGDQAGVAVATYSDLVEPADADDRTVRIYSLDPSPELELAQSADNQVSMIAVAGIAADHAVALDSSNTTWRLADGQWVQETGLATALPADRSLRAVASTPGGSLVDGHDGWATEFVAGSAGADGALWRRTRWEGREQSWTRDTLPPGTPSLAGVAATAWNAAWAVGANGTVLRYWTPPDPNAHAAAEQAAADEAYRQEQERLYQEQLAAEQAAADQAAADQAAAEQAAADQAAAEQAAAEQAAAEQPEAEISTAPPPPVERDQINMNGVVIDDSPTRRAGQKRLLTNVRVVRRGQRLIVGFRLRAKARVGLVAKRGRRVIARKPMRTFRKGRRRIVLRFRGRPPSSLKVVVRRVSGARDNR